MDDDLPNVVVLLGSESDVLRPLVDSMGKDSRLVRVYSRRVPEPMANAVDVADVASLPEVLAGLDTGKAIRLAFVGAASKRQNSLLVELSGADIDEMLETNVDLYVKTARLLLPIMIRNKYGRFVYLSSFRANNPVRGTSIYSASKAFGETFFAAIGKEYGRFGISSTSIRMGYFGGGMFDDYDPGTQEQAVKTIAMRRTGRPDDLEAAIKFCFATPYASSGVIDLNGGLNLG